MERAPGAVPVGWHELPAGERQRLGEQAIDVLADLHAIDVEQTPLADRAAVAADGARRFRKLYDRLAPLPPVAAAAFWWLDRHRPPPPDHRGRSSMATTAWATWSSSGGRITGVLDWEMAAPGDPLTDLVWCFIPVWVPALVDEEPLLRRYAERTGIELDPERRPLAPRLRAAAALVLLPLGHARVRRRAVDRPAARGAAAAAAGEPRAGGRRHRGRRHPLAVYR